MFSTFSHALVLASHCFCSMPMIMCEYAHAMGSAFGSGCADFERAFRLLEFRRCLLATFGPVSKLPFDHFPICLFSSRSQTRPKHKPVHRWFILALEYLVGCTAPFCIQIHFFSNYFLMQCVLSLIRDFASRCRCRFLAFLLRIFPAQQPVTVSRRP